MNHIGAEALDPNILVFIDKAAKDKQTSTRHHGWSLIRNSELEWKVPLAWDHVLSLSMYTLQEIHVVVFFGRKKEFLHLDGFLWTLCNCLAIGLLLESRIDSESDRKGILPLRRTRMSGGWQQHRARGKAKNSLASLATQALLTQHTFCPWGPCPAGSDTWLFMTWFSTMKWKQL